MIQSDQSVNEYQVRIALCWTGPHIWDHSVARSDSTLGQFHQVVRAPSGCADLHPHRFVLRGLSLGACPTASASFWLASEALLTEFRFRSTERFFYIYRFHDAGIPVCLFERTNKDAFSCFPKGVAAMRSKQPFRWAKCAGYSSLQCRFRGTIEAISCLINRVLHRRAIGRGN